MNAGDALRHPVALLGAALATIAGVLIVALFVAGFVGFHGGPYVGVVAYVALPAVLVVGLVLIPLGVHLERRRRARFAERGELEPPLPVLDLNAPRMRVLAIAFVALTTVNLVLLAGAGYKGVEVMDSTAFCGSCHSVMDPEASAHARSPHARVRCVECHIGPGASWFVKSKLSGTWQLVSVTFQLYPRPIPTPVHDLRPARDTCEQCHWPTKFVGDRLRVVTTHADDEASTPLRTVLLLHVGGTEGTRPRGIHWHVDPGVRVRYLADPKREHVATVELATTDGTRRDFQTSAAAPVGAQWREMDCVDCHNRPTHVYRTPEEEVDAAIEAGLLDRKLPYVRREALKALRAEYPSHAEARSGLAAAMASTYAALARARSGEIALAGRTLGDIWTRNVWPSMNIRWGTYPTLLGHDVAPGCFRCHDDQHTTKDGRTISGDCGTCHELLANEERDPPVLKLLAP